MRRLGLIAASFGLFIIGCTHEKPHVGERLARKGDEIVIAGQFFHTGAPVVTWMDPGGFDAYRTERRFAPWDKSDFETTLTENKGARDKVHSANRFDLRFAPTSRPVMGDGPLTPEELDKVRGGGWPLEMVQQKVDQFVYHFDVCGTSRQCFNILHDHRGLSVHFMLDVDGTIYQTLDVKERGWHATSSNSRSVGIEIANIGCYPAGGKKGVLEEWYRQDDNGHTRMVLPAWMKQDWIRTPNFIARPARDEPIVGEIQGHEYRMYDLTPQQYDSLIKLTAALCRNLPKLNCDYPRDEHGKLLPHTLPDARLATYQGLMGHYHVQDNKQDPGPAFQWDKITNGARKLLGLEPLPPGDYINNPAARDSMAVK